MKHIGIIPARFASTRFPGKPLAHIHGKSMVQRVYEQCQKSKLDKIIVATDDERIFQHVKEFGGEVVMTATSHKSGTDRIAEAVKSMQLHHNDIIVNVQGDEPFINPKDINKLCHCLSSTNQQIATLIKKIKDNEILFNSNIPKVVLGTNQQALYFSREAIPHLRAIAKEKWHKQNDYFQHIGLYAFRKYVLEDIAGLKPSVLEQKEGLEQLRWLENGYYIYTTEIDSECIAVDCPEDLKRIGDRFFS